MSLVRLLAAKDLRLMVRSRVILVGMLLYPVLVAALVGLVIQGSAGRSAIALVNEDTTGRTLDVGGSRFSVDAYRRQAEASGIRIRPMTRDAAMRALDRGEVSGVMVIPQGFMAKLATALSPSTIEFHTGDNVLGDQAAERVRGAIYRLNLKVSRAFIEENAGYLNRIVEGGAVEVLGEQYDLYGLERAGEELSKLRSQTTDEGARQVLGDVIGFADDTRSALDLADRALNATAAPVRVRHVREEGASPLLTSRALSIALVVSLAFICIVLVASSLGGERDERVLGRLLLSGVRGWQVVAAKIIVGVLVGTLFALGLFAVFGALAPQAWVRLPLLLACVMCAAAALGSIGALVAVLARDGRAATLVALLVSLPMLPLVAAPPTGPVHTLAGVLPIGPAVTACSEALFSIHPVSAVAAPCAQLLATGLLLGVASARLVRRLA